MSKDDRELIERLNAHSSKVPIGELRNDLRTAADTLATRLEALQAQPVGEVVEACRQRAIVLFQAFARGVRKFPDEEAAYVNDVETFVTAIDDAYAPLAALTAFPPVVGTTPGVNCPSCGHRLPVGYSGPCVACDAPNVLDLPGAPIVEREAIARIIDPREWDEAETYRVRADEWFAKGRTEPGDALTDGYRRKADEMQAKLLAKADAILALTPVEGVGERALRDTVVDLLAIVKGDLSGPAQVSGVISEAEAALAALTASPPVVEREAIAKEFVDHFRDAVGEDAWLSVPQYLQTWIMGKAGAVHLALSTPVAQGDEVREVLSDIAAERERQISAEGWTPEHDDEHHDGSLAKAAACYARGSRQYWPWDRLWWKPRGKRVNLIRAGALIVAEIERLDRATLTKGARDAG